MQQLNQPRIKSNPWRRYTANQHRIQTIHRIGKTAIGRIIPPVGTTGQAFCGRWRNRYAWGFTVADVLAQLKAFRDEHRAKEDQIITFQLASEHLLVNAGCLALFGITHAIDYRKGHTRQAIRRAILAKRSPKAHLHLAMLARIPFNQ